MRLIYDQNLDQKLELYQREGKDTSEIEALIQLYQVLNSGQLDISNMNIEESLSAEKWHSDVVRASEASTTSTSYVDVTSLSIVLPVDFSGGNTLILYSDITARSNAGRHNFHILVDSTVVAVSTFRCDAPGYYVPVNMHVVYNIPSGTHTIKIQYKTADAGTIYSAVEGNTDYSEARLSVIKL